MKRTLMIGLLGALSTLPVSIGIVYTMLALAVPSYLSGGGIETRGTHLFYTATGRVAVLLSLIIPVLIVGIQALMLWLILRDLRRNGETQKAFLPQMLKGLGIVLVLLLFSRVIVFPFRMAYEVAGGVVNLIYIKEEAQWWSWLIMTGAFAAILAPGGFILWATLHAAASSSPANRFRPFVVPLVAYLLTLLGLAAFSQVLTTRLDWGRTLKEIPGLRVESRTLPGVLVMSGPGGSYSLPGYRGGNAIVGLPADAVVPFTERNALLIRERLARRNYWTFLSEDAWAYLAEERWRALDPDGAVRIHTEAFERDYMRFHMFSLLGALRTLSPRP